MTRPEFFPASSTARRHLRPARWLAIAGAVFSSLTNPPATRAQLGDAAAGPEAVPWGISSSAGSMRTHAEWFPKMSAAGVSWVRLFPEWRGVEPTPGAWKWERTDTMLKSAAENKIQIEAILMGSAPGTKKAHAFPMTNLVEWSNFVAVAAARYKDQIRFWEVWNEGNGGFNDDHHTTVDYAKLVAATYNAAKQADAKAQVGLTVASYDAPYLHQTILALAKMGKPNAFDYLCIHPYEIADGLTDVDGEIPYLWMTRHLREMLRASAPDRANADIWITEVGRRIESKRGSTTTETDAAKALAKIYTMALAQGIKRTMWFEARDPVGEDQGFGLLDRSGGPRASYNTFKVMAACFGASPKYQGWLALGSSRRGYGFVFQGVAKTVLVAWMPVGETDRVIFGGNAEVSDTSSNSVSTLRAGQPLPLTDTPVFVVGVPSDLLGQARANAGRNFPWGGDYSAAKTVGLQLGSSAGSKGVFQVGKKSTPRHTFPDGTTGIRMESDQDARFYLHPSFANFQTRDYYIRIAVRRLGEGNVGMNLHYEVADSQGRAAYKNRGQWFGLSKETGWQTHTWHVNNACFSKMWGYDFSFRPEQSVPFVIGQIEVSTVPF